MSNDNTLLIEALKQADNAIQKAINALQEIVSLKTDEEKEAAYRYCIQEHKLEPYQAAGIVGNLSIEK